MSKRIHIVGSFASFLNQYSNRVTPPDEFVFFGDVSFLNGLSAFSVGTFFKTAANFSTAAEAMIAKDATANRTFYLAGFQVGGQNRIRFLVSDDGTTNDALNSNTNLSIDTWYHALATWDGANMFIYLNGVQDGTRVTSNTTGGTLFDSTTALNVGRTGLAGTNFNGFLFHQGAVNRAVNSTEAMNWFLKGAGDLRTLFGTDVLWATHFPGGQADYPTQTDYVGGVNGTMQNQEFSDINTDVP